MITFTTRKNSIFHKTICSVVAMSFLMLSLTPPASAQIATGYLNLPVPGTMLAPSAGYIPALVKGITVDPSNPLHFQFILDTGHSRLEGEALREESDKLIKYFLASLTVPEDELWVNLSPYEKERMIPDAFGTTAMGRDLLAQDYILKQLSASLMYPEEELGKEFWARVKKQAYELYGTTEIPMNTFNKVWIVPDEATVYENDGTAFIVKSHLKVMLEEDYLALHIFQKEEARGKREDSSFSHLPSSLGTPADTQMISGVTSAIIKEILIPEIEREVNEGKSFANLRQIYNAVILSTWYKINLKNTLLGQLYVDQNKVLGIDLQDKTSKDKIYAQYLEAFKIGVYNYIKEDYDPVSKEFIPRKYFSGGTSLKTNVRQLNQTDLAQLSQEELVDLATASRKTGRYLNVAVDLLEVDEDNIAEAIKLAQDITVWQETPTEVVDSATLGLEQTDFHILLDAFSDKETVHELADAINRNDIKGLRYTIEGIILQNLGSEDPFEYPGLEDHVVKGLMENKSIGEVLRSYSQPDRPGVFTADVTDQATMVTLERAPKQEQEAWVRRLRASLNNGGKIPDDMLQDIINVGLTLNEPFMNYHVLKRLKAVQDAGLRPVNVLPDYAKQHVESLINILPFWDTLDYIIRYGNMADTDPRWIFLIRVLRPVIEAKSVELTGSFRSVEGLVESDLLRMTPEELNKISDNNEMSMVIVFGRDEHQANKAYIVPTKGGDFEGHFKGHSEAMLNLAPFNRVFLIATAQKTRDRKPELNDAAMTGGEYVSIPRNFSAALGKHALVPKNIHITPITGGGKLSDLLEEPIIRFALESTTAAALGSFNLRGRGRKSPKGFDIKTAADGGAVQMVEETAKTFMGNHPKYAIVDLASEGPRDGAPSSPVGRISHISLNDEGYIDTVEFDEKGRVIRFDFDLYKKTIDALRAKGIKIFYKITDALEKTEGLTNPEALHRPTDSWALTALIGDVKVGHYRLPIDDNSRTAGTSYNAPVKADIQPLDLPSKTIPEILKAKGYRQGTPEYKDALSRVVFFALGPRDVNLDKASGNKRHMHFIDDALAFQQQHPGVQVDTDSDGDLMPRILAELGEVELLDNRIIIVTDRSGSAEAAAAKAFARTVKGAHFLARQVSTKATADAVTPENAGAYYDFEIETSKILHYGHDDLHVIKDASDEPGPTAVAMSAVTGATDRFGQKFSEALKRMTYNDRNNTVTTNTMLSDLEGNVYLVQVTFESEDIKEARRSINKVTPAAHRVAEDLGLNDEAMASDPFEIRDAHGRVRTVMVEYGRLIDKRGDEVKPLRGRAGSVLDGQRMPIRPTDRRLRGYVDESDEAVAAQSPAVRETMIQAAALLDGFTQNSTIPLMFPVTETLPFKSEATPRLAGLIYLFENDRPLFDRIVRKIVTRSIDQDLGRDKLFTDTFKLVQKDGHLGHRVRDIFWSSIFPGNRVDPGIFSDRVLPLVERYKNTAPLNDQEEEALNYLMRNIGGFASPAKNAGDEAMAGSLNYGGIDLNPQLLNLQIKRDGRGIPLPVEMQQIENIRIDGFVPLIINITPITNMPMLLGIADQIPAEPFEHVQGDDQRDWLTVSQRKFEVRDLKDLVFKS